MAIQKIIKYPATSLRVSVDLVPLPRPVYPHSLSDHLDDLRDTLLASEDGLAIASNQVLDHGWRVFVVNKSKIDFPLDIVVNPNWKPQGSAKQVIEVEGCLSFPGMTFAVPRWDFIILSCQDVHGNLHEIQASGLAARMVQHECDHLDGKLFIEQLPKKVQLDVRNEAIRRRKAGRW